MAQTNYTPISLYYSTTASAVPTAANLVPGELAINTNDGKLYYEDSSGVVQVLATKSTGSIGGSNTQVQFNNSGSLGGSSSFTWDGTTVTATKFAGAFNGTVGATTPSTGAFTTLSTSSTTTLSGLTASTALALDASKNVVSVTNTGTGNNVLSASPTLTGTIAGASLSLSSLTSGRVTYATTSGLLTDSANLTFDGNNFVVGNGFGTFQANQAGVYLKSTGAFNPFLNFYSSSTTVEASIYGVAGAGAFVIGTGGSSTERMRITSTGLVGIGTSSPGAPLDILSTTSNPSVIVRTGASDCIVSFKNTGSGGREYWIDSGGTGAGVGAGNLAFYDATASATRMVIDAGGNLIVGAISTVGSGGKAQVYSTADTFYVQSNVNAPYSAIIANVQYTACNLIAFQYSNPLVNVGAISTNGTITVYGTTSDYRLKENIVPMTGALATVAQLKPVTYKWKSDGSDGQGFIAHELQAVVPDAVHGEKDAVDADGNPVYQNVDTSHLIATLTAAIQEQQALIESLTTRLTNLENK